MEILNFIRDNQDNDWKQKLFNDHGIKTKVDLMYPELVNLCYDQIACKKTHPLTFECRGLVVDDELLKVQSLPFKRFFNYGEAKEYTDQVNFENCVVYEKLDGSLITLYYSERYQQWMVSTKGTPTTRNAIVSIGDGKGLPMIFLVAEALGIDCNFDDGIYTEPRQEYLEHYRFAEVMKRINDTIDELGLDQSLTYVFELVSPYINIVTNYDTTELYLIGMFHTASGEDYSDLSNAWFKTPNVYPCSGIDDIMKTLKFMNKDSDTLREGFVVQCMDTLTRVKIKNGAYLKVHKNLGKDGLDDKALVEIVADFEEDEVLTYYPEYQESIDSLVDKRNNVIENIRVGLELAKHSDNQKELAMKLKEMGIASFVFPSIKKGIDDPLVAFSESSKKMRMLVL